MARTILGAVFGYIAMVIFVMASFSLAYLAMGPETAYKQGSFEVSGIWIAASFVLGFVAALIGGAVSVIVARRVAAATALAVFTVVLGFILAVAMATSTKAQDVGPRTAEVSAVEAMNKSITPTWVAFANPILGAAGVLLGGRVGRRPTPASPREATPK